jgi:ferredoxin-NADP reductase
MTETADRLTMRLRRMGWEADGVLSLDFVAPDATALPAFTPGAHVDLHMPDGQIRQYSLCGDPADRSTYRIAVRAVEGGRVSRAIHRDLRPGALLTVGLPRNNFPLLPSPRYLFVAGGIGITPLLPMMREASRLGSAWSLLFCARRAADAPFLNEALALGGSVVVHESEAGTRLDVAARLRDVPEATLLYCCGPERLMTAVEDATSHWPEGTVHFEWFTPKARPADETSGGFELVCAQSGLTLTVPPDRSVLDILTEAGITVPTSCEQGICGTCECRVLEGEVDHRDSILSASEQAANQTMMVCVSRAKSARLVLDL